MRTLSNLKIKILDALKMFQYLRKVDKWKELLVR